MTGPARPFRSLLGIGLPLLAIGAFFVLFAFSLLHLYSIQTHMRLEAPHNMLWVISRAQIASLRLTNAVAARAADQLDAAGVQRQYSVFLSRMSLLEQGPQRRQVEVFGFADRLDTLRETLPELKSRMAALRPGDTDNAWQIEQLLAPFSTTLGLAANKAMVTEWENTGNKLDDVREQLWQLIVSLVGILVAGVALIVHAWMSSRRAHERTRLLNREKAFSQLLIASSGENIIAVDLERRCTVWNMAAEQMFSCPADLARGRVLGEISGFFQVDHVRHAIDEALAGRTSELADQPFFPNGQHNPRYVDLRCFALYNNDVIIGSILLIHDVTERRAAQREIAMHRDHLEELVQARTQELDAALERERTAAELYRNFGAMVSHQFRTPLSIVDSALQRLIRRSGDVSAAEICERGNRARDAIGRMTRLIESTLDAARLDAGQVQIHSQPCNLDVLVAGVCRQQGVDPDRVIDLTLSVKDTPIVNCDPTHVEHILNNLIANAIKYSDTGTAISVSVHCDDETAGCAVSNRGSIPDEMAAATDSLFERYVRGDNAKGHTGVGIGLYMARALARLQEGDVQLVQDQERVVTFVLHLPRMAADRAPQPGAVGESA